MQGVTTFYYGDKGYPASQALRIPFQKAKPFREDYPFGGLDGAHRWTDPGDRVFVNINGKHYLAEKIGLNIFGQPITRTQFDRDYFIIKGLLLNGKTMTHTLVTGCQTPEETYDLEVNEFAVAMQDRWENSIKDKIAEGAWEFSAGSFPAVHYVQSRFSEHPCEHVLLTWNGNEQESVNLFSDSSIAQDPLKEFAGVISQAPFPIFRFLTRQEDGGRRAIYVAETLGETRYADGGPNGTIDGRYADRCQSIFTSSEVFKSISLLKRTLIHEAGEWLYHRIAAEWEPLYQEGNPKSLGIHGDFATAYATLRPSDDLAEALVLAVQTLARHPVEPTFSPVMRKKIDLILQSYQSMY